MWDASSVGRNINHEDNEPHYKHAYRYKEDYDSFGMSEMELLFKSTSIEVLVYIMDIGRIEIRN